MEAAMDVSKVSVICGKCKEAARIRNRILDDGKKVRICSKCNDVIDVG